MISAKEAMQLAGQKEKTDDVCEWEVYPYIHAAALCGEYSCVLPSWTTDKIDLRVLRTNLVRNGYGFFVKRNDENGYDIVVDWSRNWHLNAFDFGAWDGTFESAEKLCACGDERLEGIA